MLYLMLSDKIKWLRIRFSEVSFHFCPPFLTWSNVQVIKISKTKIICPKPCISRWWVAGDAGVEKAHFIICSHSSLSLWDRKKSSWTYFKYVETRLSGLGLSYRVIMGLCLISHSESENFYYKGSSLLCSLLICCVIKLNRLFKKCRHLLIKHSIPKYTVYTVHTAINEYRMLSELTPWFTMDIKLQEL